MSTQASQSKITPREKEILHLIAHEHSSKEIASKLYVSYETVNTHRKNIMSKLGVRNTAGMVRVGFQMGLLRLATVLILLFISGGLQSQASFEMIGGTASGSGAAAIGDGTTASGKASMAIGLNTSALADYSFAVGDGAQVAAGGFGGVSIGSSFTNSEFSVTIGINNVAEPGSASSAVFGAGNVAKGASSLVAGQENTAYSFAETVIGQFAMGYSGATASVSNVPSDRLFTIGNGSSNTERSNALELYKSGNLRLNGNLTLPDDKTLFIGNDTIANGTKLMWLPSFKTLIAGESTGAQWYPNVFGSYNAVFGLDNSSAGWYNIISGQSNTIQADAHYSILSGKNNLINEHASYTTINGQDNKSISTHETIFGRFADTTQVSGYTGVWDGDHQLFALGNGSSTADRNNALTVLKNGNIGIDTITNYRLHVLADQAQTLQVQSKAADGTYLTLRNSSAGGQVWLLNNTGSSYPRGAGHLAIGSTSAQGALFLENSGEVGIGTEEPTEKLDVNGNIRIRNISSGLSGDQVYIDANGVLFTMPVASSREHKNSQPSNNNRQLIENLSKENQQLRERLDEIEIILKTILKGQNQ